MSDGCNLRLDAHLFFTLHEIASARQPPVHRDSARADPLLQARARVLRQSFRKSLVEAQAGKAGREREGMAAELRGRIVGPSPRRGIRYTSADWSTRIQ